MKIDYEADFVDTWYSYNSPNGTTTDTDEAYATTVVDFSIKVTKNKG